MKVEIEFSDLEACIADKVEAQKGREETIRHLEDRVTDRETAIRQLKTVMALFDRPNVFRDLRDYMATCDRCQKISNIKRVRELTGWGLKESKDFVEQYPPAQIDVYNEPDPD
jgi:hypothetical protein